MVWAWLTFAPRPDLPRASVDEDIPRGPRITAEAPGSLEELKAQLAAVLEREHITGATFALVDQSGPIWIGGLGLRDREARLPMQPSTAFRVGSVSKSIVALGVMRLVDQGKLDLDRPLREILPDLEFSNPWEAESPVTLAQVMEHTTGFDDIRFNEIFGPEEISVAETLARNPRSRVSRWRPGTRHGYSNIGFTIAARAIEVVTGEPFDVYLRREVMTPIGMTDADFRRTPVLEERLATGYMENDAPIEFRSFAHRPSGSLLASAVDLAKLAQFWLRRGDGYDVVSRAGLARIEQSKTLPYPHVDGEYGFANYGDVMHPVIARGHDGGMPGFHSSFRYIPELGVGYAVLLNSNYTFRGYFEIRALIFAYLTHGRVFPPPPEGEPKARPTASFYRLANPRHDLFAFMDRTTVGWGVVDEGSIVHVAGLEGEHWDLVPTRDGNYRFTNEHGSSSQFITVDGTPLMLAGFLYAEATDEWCARLKFAALRLVMHLMTLAPLYAIAILVLGRRRKLVPTATVVWPAIAALCCSSLSYLLIYAFFYGVIGEPHPLTVALCGSTILFAIAAVATLFTSLRALVEPGRSRLALLVPLACGISFTGYAVWWGANGMIGLRTWAY